MKQVGICFRVVLSIGFVAVSVNVRAQAVPPPDMPSQDAIQRLLDEERRLRGQGLDNPITQEAIANAQQVDRALADIGRKAQSDLLAVSQLAQQASQAARNVDAISKYRMAIILENDFKVYATAQLKNLLRADHPVYVKALNTLELPMRDIRAGYLKVTQVMVEAAWQRNEFDDARGFIMDTLGWLPGNADLQALLRESEKLNAAFVKHEPSPDASSMREALANRDLEINRLLKDGRFHYEMRDLDNAKLNFDRVLLLDGRNDVASNFLRMINKFKNDAAKDSRDRNFSAMVQEVNEKWVEAPHQRTLPVPNPTWINQTGGSANQPGGPGANNVIMKKLQSIRVPSVPPLAGMALNEVVNLITQMAAENDTISLDQKDKGINIWIRTDLPEYAKIAGNFPFQGSPNINPANGLPMRRPVMKHAGGSMADGTDSGVLAPGGRMNAGLPSVPTIGGGRLDPTRITVQGLTAPLTNVSLSQLLNIITKSCDQPIDWKVSEGTVMLSYRPADADFVTKLFQVKPNAFFTELIKVKPTVRQITPLPKSPLGEGFDSTIRSKNTQSNGGGNLYINRQTGQPINGGGGWAGGGGAGGGVGGVNQAASAAVQAYLANFGITNAQVVFNPSNGQLLVRAQLANLEQIEQVIEILNTSPEQLVIEAKFAEIEFNEGESLGFDWYLGNFTMQNGKYITGAGPQPTFIGKPTASNPSGFFPYPGTLQGNTFVPSQYSIQPSANEGRLTSGFKGYGNALWSFTGLMTDPQFRVVLNAIDQQDGAELLSAPRILAISGRQANISVQDNRSIVTGVQPTFTPGAGGGFGGGGGGGGGTVTPIVTQQQMGPSLTVLPYVNADGYTIEMSIAPSITEFLGYEESTFEASVFAGNNVVTTTVPLPRIRTRDINVQCVVWDQTVLALGGLIAETVQTTKDKVPFLGDLPFLGRLWRGEGRSSKKKNMVIYVKPTIIDPAGNPKNRPGQLPFARTTSPDPITFINPDNPNANLGGAGGVPGGGAPGGINNKLLNRSNYRR
ncbi:MAG TPA: hypothetical protein EYG19_01870 [Verrucomicrobia bacterium]|nr:hypothetical protein [Verrucomicrobiota bacterium]